MKSSGTGWYKAILIPLQTQSINNPKTNDYFQIQIVYSFYFKRLFTTFLASENFCDSLLLCICYEHLRPIVYFIIFFSSSHLFFSILSMDEDDIIVALLSEVEVLDRDAFISVIQSSYAPKDEESIALGHHLFTKFISLYSVNEQERIDWYELLELIKDDNQRADFKFSYFSLLIPDNNNTEFISRYLNYINSEDAKIALDEESILEEVAKYSTIEDFQNGFKLFQLGLNIIESSNLDALSKAELIKSQYLKQLNIKHHQIDETFQNYSQFISKYDISNYDLQMSEANKIYELTKSGQFDLESFYYKQSNHISKEFYLSYLNYLSSVSKQNRNINELLVSFENSISESDDSELWVSFLSIFDEYNEKEDNNNHLLIFLSRFLKRFPYSSLPYTEILKGIPHRFSEKIYNDIKPRLDYFLSNFNPGYVEWKELAINHLNLLFKLNDPNLDSTTENYFMKAIEFNDTPFHSIERFIVNSYEKYKKIDKSRYYLRLITSNFENQSENWLISYYFEQRNGTLESCFKILTAAINRAENLDWPDRIIEEYLRFGQLYQSNNLKNILIKISKKKKLMISQSEEIIEEPTNKRSYDDIDDEDGSKKRKTVTNVRDRENLTVSISNIPPNISEKQILNFFKDCGDVNESKMVAINDVQQFHIEFTNENSVLRALAKDYKKFSNTEIRVQRLLKNTIWVTNFPPSFTQIDLENTFSSVGIIVNVRLPSLKFNSQRRFCYIQFINSEIASEAVNKFDSKIIDGYKLIVKISDPNSKINRSGATEEGREVFVSKLDFYKVNSFKLKQLFEKYGVVENVHLPLSAKNKEQGKKHDGYGFVVFKTSEEAQESLKLNLVSFEGRAIEVSISKKKKEKEKHKEKFGLIDYRNSENVLALKDLPDTINSSQLKAFFQNYGEIVDVILEQNSDGALIIFSNPKEVGETSLKVEGRMIGDYQIKITTVSELKRLKNRNKDTPATINTSFIPSSLRRKPKSIVTNRETKKSEVNNQIEKTNDDFRAMLLGNK